MTATRRCAAFLSLAIAVALTTGCEDSGVTAPTDATVTVTASPSTISIDPNRLVETPPGSGVFLPQSQGSATISAVIRNAGGDALQGVSVSFSTTAGSLASQGTSQTVETDANGLAQDVLTVATADPASIDVTATSGTISGDVTVTKTTGTVNAPPVARVVITPPSEQALNDPVLFDGSTSSDPDGTITVYRWSIYSTAGPSEVVEGQGVDHLNRDYPVPQTLTGTLQVTDDPAAVRQLALHEPIVYRSTATFSYSIVSSTCPPNAAPVAIIAGPTSLALTGAAGSSVTATLDGSASHDSGPTGLIVAYVWACGTGTLPVPVPGSNNSRVACTYPVQATAKTYTATLRVKDNGTGGSANPDGSYACEQVSSQVSVSIVVTPTAASQQ